MNVKKICQDTYSHVNVKTLGIITKNYQMLSEILNNSDKNRDEKEKKKNEENYKIMEDMMGEVWKINDRVNKNFQILEDIKKGDENTNKKQNKNTNEKIFDENYRKYEEINKKMEDKNVIIMKGMESKNENLTKENIKLKERIVNINKSEWKTKFTENSSKNLDKLNENLNVTDLNKFKTLTCYDKSLQDKENFKCYTCDKTFSTMNLLMNHKKKQHKIIRKCRNLENCKYEINCWYSHTDSENESIHESIKRYYTV